MSAARTTSPSPVHLVVIIHGLWGSPEHVGHLASTLEKISGRTTNSTPLSILIPGSIQWTNTYDGIDYCAEHVAQEIDQRRAELEMDGKVLTKFSCIGVSIIVSHLPSDNPINTRRRVLNSLFILVLQTCLFYVVFLGWSHCQVSGWTIAFETAIFL
jgi:hypothetical protein